MDVKAVAEAEVAAEGVEEVPEEVPEALATTELLPRSSKCSSLMPQQL